MKFETKLRHAIAKAESPLCIGLDPQLSRLPNVIKEQYNTPAEQVFEFCRQVIMTTRHRAAAYKPNLAFFEALGPEGLEVFSELLAHIPNHIVVIADAKRGDISTTAEHYKKAFFEQLEVDAITLNPLMGLETLEAFGDDASKAVYALALTSNPGAHDFLLKPVEGFKSLAAYIAFRLEKESSKMATHLGMVIGATQSHIAQDVLHNHPHASLLIPGFGAQGGHIQDLALLLKSHKGLPLINSSRGILYDAVEASNSEQSSWLDRVLLRTEAACNALHPIYQQIAV